MMIAWLWMGWSLNGCPAERAGGRFNNCLCCYCIVVSMDARPSARADYSVEYREEDEETSQWMPGRARGRTSSRDWVAYGPKVSMDARPSARADSGCSQA